MSVERGELLGSRALSDAVAGEAPRSLWRQAAIRFRRNHAAMGSIYVLIAIALASTLIPMFWPHGIEDASWEKILAPPSFDDYHWFGTDANGRDLFVRVFYGGRVSLTIGLLTTFVALSIGVTYGAVAGFLGGRTDGVMMRFVDILYSLPLLFFIIILVTVFGRNIYPGVRRHRRRRVADHVAHRARPDADREGQGIRRLGRGHRPVQRAILRRYIIPNVLGPVIVYVTLLIPTNIMVESYLSFIGLGVQEPLTSWGLLISQGAGQLDSAPWLLVFPATLPGRHHVLLQLHRRRSARRAGPPGSLSA